MSVNSSAPNNNVLPGSPFKGWPPTKQKRDESGGVSFSVNGNALTPFGARLANYGAAASGLVMFSAGLYGLWESGTFEIETLGNIAGVVAASIPATWLALRYILKRGVHITFSDQEIVIRKAMSTRSFKRAYPHAFALLAHDKATLEKERHAFLDRKRPPKWWSLQRKKYYGKSYHIVLNHLGERYDILSVYGRKRATKIHARLQACDAVVSGADFGDSGVALSPERDWASNAGGL